MSIENLALSSASEAVPAKRSVLKVVLRDPLGLISGIFILLILVFGFLAPVLAPFDPNFTDLALTNAQPFGDQYFLGGDQAGRDILSRLMFATGTTLSGSVVLLGVSVFLGVSTGLIAGYYGGIFDAVSGWVADVILALPGIVLLIALYTVIGPSTLTAMAVFGVLVAPSYFRLVRSLVINIRHELYVDAAKVSGLSDLRIISRHVLRAVRAPIIIQSSFVLGAGIAIQAGLDFLGLGNPADPSWGGMLREAFNSIYLAGVNITWPATVVTLTSLAFALLGNAIRDGLQNTGSSSHELKPSAIRELRRVYPRQQTPSPVVSASTGEERPEVPHLSISNLVLAYPDSDSSVREVIKGVNLDVQKGEIHGLVGESGSGKSQTAFSVLGILPKGALILGGKILYDGKDLLTAGALQKNLRGTKIGYIPQEPMSNLDPAFTVGRQLVYGLRAIKKISKEQAKADVIALLARVGINDPERTFNSYPHQISGGMAQRVLIAGAIASDPEFIIADEPTTALDVTVQAEVLDLLRELQKERQLGMILVTHNFGVVADICDRVSVMQQGSIVESNSTRELFTNPQHDYTKMLLGSTLDDSELRSPLTSHLVRGA